MYYVIVEKGFNDHISLHIYSFDFQILCVNALLRKQKNRMYSSYYIKGYT